MEGKISSKDWGQIIKLSKELNGAEKIVHYLADIFYQQNNVIKTTPSYDKKLSLSDIAASNRKKRLENTTESEILFANLLSKARIKHKREYVFYPKKSFYIADFYIPEVKLVIEIDGKYHEEDDQMIKDADRTSKLINECGVREVLRFKNEELIDNIKCIKTLKSTINKLKDSKYRKLIR